MLQPGPGKSLEQHSRDGRAAGLVGGVPHWEKWADVPFLVEDDWLQGVGGERGRGSRMAVATHG